VYNNVDFIISVNLEYYMQYIQYSHTVVKSVKHFLDVAKNLPAYFFKIKNRCKSSNTVIVTMYN